MREVKYHPKASAEALHSARFYNRRQPGLGTEFFDELDRAIAQVLQDPLRFPADGEGIRSWRLRRFPFRAYYVIEPDRIRILAVAHLRRRPGYWRQRADD